MGCWCRLVGGDGGGQLMDCLCSSKVDNVVEC